MDVTSSVGTAPERSRASTRERLVASATALFARDGVHQVTSHEIARTAGVAAGTFYLHFKDKQSLFREIVFEALDRLKECLQKAAEGAANAEEAVCIRSAALLAFAEQRRDLVRILFRRVGEAAPLTTDVLERLIRWLEDDLRAWGERRNGEARADPEVAAQALVGMWARVLTWWAEEPGRVPRETVLRSLIRLQLTGVLAGA